MEDFGKRVNAAKAAEKVGLKLKVTHSVPSASKPLQRKPGQVGDGPKTAPEAIPIVFSGQAESMEPEQAESVEQWFFEEWEKITSDVNHF